MVFGYVATLRSSPMLWLITLPLALIGEYGWIATPAMALIITFLFLNVEQMALEIEQPFGDDANDLPIEEYILALEKEMLEMIADYDKKAEEAKVGAEEPDTPATTRRQRSCRASTPLVPPRRRCPHRPDRRG